MRVDVTTCCACAADHVFLLATQWITFFEGEGEGYGFEVLLSNPKLVPECSLHL